jgi:hypothetical protein
VVGCRIEDGELPRQPTPSSAGTKAESAPGQGGAAGGEDVSEGAGGKEPPAQGEDGGARQSDAGESHSAPEQGGAVAGGAGGAGGELPTDCNVNEGCEARCREPTRTCSVVDIGIACEFKKYAGTSLKLTCGELTSVGEVNCGACGPVDFKIYFDGQSCWQGIPDCERGEFKGILFRVVE